MTQKLVITLSEEATAEYLRRIGEQTEAEVEASVEPSGAQLNVEIPPDAAGACSIWLGHIELGEASVSIE